MREEYKKVKEKLKRVKRTSSELVHENFVVAVPSDATTYF